MCKEIIFPADEVIRENGGVGPLAEKLGYDYQRVFNWKVRGIPALEVALRPDIFAAATRAAQENLIAGEASQQAHVANTRASCATHAKLDLERLA